ncbi:phosphodiesterase DibA [Pseudomonas saudiphocaensis]|uniref:phosphodiesterase DibA n=1 Tax=Pseudomonas saudiphocaensis TaxID=1499686 RepID=UPI002AAF4731|nr:EAL domain-containing protein [Pseudomonas saudiphocaensis]
MTIVRLQRLCLFYLILAVLWVVLGELLVRWLSDNHTPVSLLPFSKGLLFVTFSTLLMYVLGRRHIDQVARQQQAQTVSQTRLRQAEAVFDCTQEGVLISDAQQRILHVNPAFSRITGYSLEEVLGQTPKLFASGKHDAEFYGQMWRDLQAKGRWSGEIWNRRKSGEVYSQLQNLRSISDENGQVTHYVAVFSDLSALKRSREELDYLAHYDHLVGLPNRLLFSERAKLDLERARTDRRSGALLLIDLDHFKDINESLGHSYGDSLLIAVSKRLGAFQNNGMTVARLGGDEFALLCESLNAGQAAALALRLLDSLAQPFQLGANELFITASIGIVLYPDDIEDVEQLMRNADSALFKAKGSGRSTYAFYTQELTSMAQQRVELSSALRQALEQNQLELHYQSIHDLSDERIVGFEALVRWRHPEQGLVSPARFIPIAEENGLISAIDLWVLARACRQMSSWVDSGLSLQFIAVNISSRLFSHGELDMLVSQILAESGLAPRYLELEVTESAVMQDPDAAMDQLARLRALGVRLAIDDFGTGHSSLLRLKRMNVHKLKIDQGFVRGLPGSREDAAITRSVIALAHNLDLRVVAEGIETPEQAEFLFDHGCDYGQGYGFARPQAPAKINWQATLNRAPQSNDA